MYSVSTKDKRCATCEYWRGMRNVSKNGKLVEYERLGQCSNSRSLKRGKEISGTEIPCNYWLQWSALR